MAAALPRTATPPPTLSLRVGNSSPSRSQLVFAAPRQVRRAGHLLRRFWRDGGAAGERGRAAPLRLPRRQRRPACRHSTWPFNASAVPGAPGRDGSFLLQAPALLSNPPCRPLLCVPARSTMPCATAPATTKFRWASTASPPPSASSSASSSEQGGACVLERRRGRLPVEGEGLQ